MISTMVVTKRNNWKKIIMIMLMAMVIIDLSIGEKLRETLEMFASSPALRIVLKLTNLILLLNFST